MLGARSLQERLVRSSTTSDDTNHTTDRALDDLLGTRRQLDAGLALIRVVADDGHVVAAGTAERTPVTNLLLDVADDGTFRNGAEGEDVADGERGVLAGVDELAGVHALVGDEGLGVELVSVRVTEDDLRERGATAGIVHNLLHDTADVAVSLGIIVCSELGRGLVETFCEGKEQVSGRAIEISRVLKIRNIRVWATKMDPRPFLWLRMTRPCGCQYFLSRAHGAFPQCWRLTILNTGGRGDCCLSRRQTPASCAGGILECAQRVLAVKMVRARAAPACAAGNSRAQSPSPTSLNTRQ